MVELAQSHNHRGTSHPFTHLYYPNLETLLIKSTQIFIILGIAVNCGGNTDHEYIGGKYWNTGDAPFVGGIGGFASVFVTASFA